MKLNFDDRIKCLTDCSNRVPKRAIKWQDRITNAEVLERSQSTGIEALLIAAQLRWAGHVWRMGDERIPKQLLYGELWGSGRHRGGQRKRFKDTLKHNMKQCGPVGDRGRRQRANVN